MAENVNIRKSIYCVAIVLVSNALTARATQIPLCNFDDDPPRSFPKAPPPTSFGEIIVGYIPWILILFSILLIIRFFAAMYLYLRKQKINNGRKRTPESGKIRPPIGGLSVIFLMYILIMLFRDKFIDMINNFITI